MPTSPAVAPPASSARAKADHGGTKSTKKAPLCPSLCSSCLRGSRLPCEATDDGIEAVVIGDVQGELIAAAHLLHLHAGDLRAERGADATLHGLDLRRRGGGPGFRRSRIPGADE